MVLYPSAVLMGRRLRDWTFASLVPSVAWQRLHRPTWLFNLELPHVPPSFKQMCDLSVGQGLHGVSSHHVPGILFHLSMNWGGSSFSRLCYWWKGDCCLLPVSARVWPDIAVWSFVEDGEPALSQCTTGHPRWAPSGAERPACVQRRDKEGACLCGRIILHPDLCASNGTRDEAGTPSSALRKEITFAFRICYLFTCFCGC